jgi:hypothetical protein
MMNSVANNASQQTPKFAGTRESKEDLAITPENGSMRARIDGQQPDNLADCPNQILGIKDANEDIRTLEENHTQNSERHFHKARDLTCPAAGKEHWKIL